MASALSVSKLFSGAAIAAYDHDPGATTAVITSPDGGTTKRAADMRDYDGFAVIAKPTVVGGGGLTLLEIIAAEDSALTTNVTQVKTSGTVAADALDDYVVLECLASELAQLGANLRYVGARLTMATATDEASVVYIRHRAKYAKDALTATTIA